MVKKPLPLAGGKKKQIQRLWHPGLKKLHQPWLVVSERGHEATETGLAYAPVSQAHGHNHIVQCVSCCTAAQTSSVPPQVVAESRVRKGGGGGLKSGSHRKSILFGSFGKVASCSNHENQRTPGKDRYHASCPHFSCAFRTTSSMSSRAMQCSDRNYFMLSTVAYIRHNTATTDTTFLTPTPHTTIQPTVGPLGVLAQ